jgi:ribosomal protein S18 acetylase RimI-like enzyme
MTVAADLVTLAVPGASVRARLRAIVEATGVFRPEEVAIALEVFDGAVARPDVDYSHVGAFAQDQLLGWAAFGATPGTLGTWDLYWIAVDPTTHGRGIGRQLMAHCEDVIALRSGRLIVVETSSRASYAPTRAFYERLGYTAQARIPGYYAPGDGLIVYTKAVTYV